jgi:hypothetical protein
MYGVRLCSRCLLIIIVSANNDVNDMLEKNTISKNNHSSTPLALNIQMGSYCRDMIPTLLKN